MATITIYQQATMTTSHNRQPRNIFQDLPGPSILQLNVEGIIHAKRDVIQQRALENSATVLLLQETHTTSDIDLKIPGFTVVSVIHNKHHGLATYARSDVSFSNVTTSPSGSNIQWIAATIDWICIVNVYKPPPAAFCDLPVFPHPTTPVTSTATTEPGAKNNRHQTAKHSATGHPEPT